MKEKTSNYVFAFDIGGSKVEFSLIDQNGHAYSEIQKYPVPFDDSGVADPEALLDIMERCIQSEANMAGRAFGIGLSLCGNIDPQTGNAVLVPNLHWHNVPFGRMVKNRFNIPVYSATDVRLAALAEAVWGAGRGISHFAWVTIGTGFGAYLFLDGKLYGGKHGFAGNFGHNTIDEIHGDPCGCGRRGCLETYVSGPAIARQGERAVVEGRSQILKDLAADGPVTTQMVFQAEVEGDPAAKEVIDSVIRRIAIGLAGLVNILDLELIILGGGVMKASPALINRIDKRTRDYLMTDEARQDLRFKPESLPNSALFGAAANIFLKKGVIDLKKGK